MRSIRGRMALHARQQGRNLVELMVTMVLGIIVLGAVLNTVATSGTSGRTMNSLAQLTEDAQVAINLVAGHARMAGFSAPRVNGIPGLASGNLDGAPIRGCDSGFANPGVGDIGNLLCAGAGQPNGFSVAYEADPSNTLTLVPGQPTDCLGQAIPLVASALGGNFFRAENRFFLVGDDLVCAGVGDAFANPQVMVRNVEDMRVTYGVGEVAAGAFGNQVFQGQVRTYLTAAELDAHPVFGPEPLATRWRRVSSVRICLVVRSEDELAEVAPFVDCFGNTVAPADRRLRVAVTTTVSLRNTSDAAL